MVIGVEAIYLIGCRARDVVVVLEVKPKRRYEAETYQGEGSRNSPPC